MASTRPKMPPRSPRKPPTVSSRGAPKGKIVTLLWECVIFHTFACKVLSASTTAPKPPKQLEDSPREPQGGHRCLTHGPRGPKDGSKTAQESPKTA
eukprot:4977565-Pyramimonas_sp.AAC.1